MPRLPDSAASLKARVLRGVALFVVPLVLLACGDDRASNADKAKAAKGAAPPPVPVKVQQVEMQSVPVVLEAVGQAEGSREVEVRARVSGILEKRTFTEGAAVKAGSVLFLIDPRPYQIAVAQAKAAVAQERARQELAQREASRLGMLAKERAISQREFEEAQSSVKQIAAAIDVAQARLAEAQLNLSYTRVTAPISGITGRAARSEGSLVTANTEASLLTTLTQVQPIWIRFALAEPDFERLRGNERGARVSLFDKDDAIAAEYGRLNFTGTTVDPKLGTVQLRAEFPNPGTRWLPGQFVKVQIVAGEQQAMLIPQAAVVQSEQNRAVWVVDGQNTVTQRPVQTAGWYQNQWIVTGGLKPGELVVIDNLLKMRPGATVKPQDATAAGAAATGGATSGEPAAAAAIR